MEEEKNSGQGVRPDERSIEQKALDAGIAIVYTAMPVRITSR